MDGQDFFTESGVAAENYIQNRLLLLKLQAVEKISKLSAAMFAGLLIGVVGCFIILFLSILLAWLFAEVLGNVFLGFGIISAFYIIVLVLMVIFRKNVLQKTITNTVINIFFEKNANHDNSDSEQTPFGNK